MVPLPPLRDGARALPISSFRQSMPSFDTRCPGLHLQPGASVVLGCVGELPGSRCTDFNPRAPCGTRLCGDDYPLLATNFNPRAPCGTRPGVDPGCAQDIDFNPRAPCGTRRALVILVDCALQISIHAPRVGRDLASSAGAIVPERFQSTRPVWGATAPPSILAP